MYQAALHNQSKETRYAEPRGVTENTEPTQVTLTEVSLPTEGPTWWAWEAGKWALLMLLACAVVLLLMKLLILWKTRRRMRRLGFFGRPVVVGFFHPFCAAAGGGERVLWHCIHALQKRYSFVRCVVYTGDSKTRKEILDVVQDRFKIVLHDSSVEFIHLKRRGWVEAGRWTTYTILGQSFGSLILGMEALLQLAPHVYIDTTGYAFTLPLFRWLGGSRTASYVHYPNVSSDMLAAVARQTSSYNNSSRISRSWWRTRFKLLYYRVFGWVYGFMGRRNDVVMVNSTWTHGHIRSLWSPRQLFIVYPPCDTGSLKQLPLKRSVRNFRIVSVGQFRPEKNHKSQIRILSELVNAAHPTPVTLVLVGGCRDSEDDERVKDLRHLAEQLQVSHCVEFVINQSFSRLRDELGKAAAALHTMEMEHFGIGLVECMAAGCVMVAHDSGGPQQDIVVDWQGKPTGYLASTEEQFVSWLLELVHMTPREREALAASGREAVHTKFSIDVFEASFLRATEKLFG